MINIYKQSRDADTLTSLHCYFSVKFPPPPHFQRNQLLTFETEHFATAKKGLYMLQQCSSVNASADHIHTSPLTLQICDIAFHCNELE